MSNAGATACQSSRPLWRTSKRSCASPTVRRMRCSACCTQARRGDGLERRGERRDGGLPSGVHADSARYRRGHGRSGVRHEARREHAGLGGDDHPERPDPRSARVRMRAGRCSGPATRRIPASAASIGSSRGMFRASCPARPTWRRSDRCSEPSSPRTSEACAEIGWSAAACHTRLRRRGQRRHDHFRAHAAIRSRPPANPPSGTSTISSTG